MPKLPDYPEAGNLSVADAQKHVKNINGSRAWGTTESMYTVKAMAVLPPDDVYRQRFLSNANARIIAAAERVPMLQDIADGIMPAVDTSKSAMTTPQARAQLERVMEKNIDGQLELQTLQALQVLDDSDAHKVAFLEVLRQRLEGEKHIRDNGPSIIAALPAAPS